LEQEGLLLLLRHRSRENSFNASASGFFEISWMFV